MQRSVFGYLSGHPGTDLRRFVKRLIGESMGRRNATRSTKAVPQGQQRPVLTFAEPARSGGLFFSLTSSIASVLNPETQAQEEASGTNLRLWYWRLWYWQCSSIALNRFRSRSLDCTLLARAAGGFSVSVHGSTHDAQLQGGSRGAAVARITRLEHRQAHHPRPLPPPPRLAGRGPRRPSPERPADLPPAQSDRTLPPAHSHHSPPAQPPDTSRP